MLTHTELKRGTYFLFENEPYEILEAAPLFKGRGSSVQQVKMKNVRTGTILQKSFHAGDNFEEAEISKRDIRFIYSRNGSYIFCYDDDPSKRFELSEEQIGEQSNFLITDMTLEGIVHEDQVINVSLPIKIQLRVTEAPPGVQGDRSQGGNKTVTVESGAQINVPLFVNEDDVIEINTQNKEYVRRVQK